MGGRAFLEKLQGATFPRMDPPTYHLLKAQHLEQLRQKFRLVAVPCEAPEKTSHGDIDYVVCSPLDQSTNSEDLKSTLSASCSISDRQTLNFAIPLYGKDASAFYQVDIHQCRDEDEWQRTMFFHGYGDLGMMMGLIARVNGLSLGLRGLKVPHAPQYNMPPFMLSTAIPRILDFFGLDFAVWEAGFPRLESTFKWVASSRFFDFSIVQESPHRDRRAEGREMYQKFLRWAKDHTQNAQQENYRHRPVLRPEKIVVEAMTYFEKRQEYESLVEKKRKESGFKDKFNGKLVMEWTGMYGKPVQEVMNEVRKNLDEEMMHRLTCEEIKNLVLKAQENMRL